MIRRLETSGAHLGEFVNGPMIAFLSVLLFAVNGNASIYALLYFPD